MTGLLYGVTGLGLVVVYRTSRVLNFAMGGVGAVAAYLAAELVGVALPYWLVIVIGVLCGALVGGIVETAVARPLRSRPHLTISLGTLGSLLILEGVLPLVFGLTPRSRAPVLPTDAAVTVGALSLSANQLLVVVLSVVVTLLLLYVMSRTRLGLSMRAASSGPRR